MANRYLSIYLQDHLAGAVGGLELARRAVSSNRGNEYGAFLEQLLRDLEEDRRALQEVMRRVGATASVVKNSAFWAAEKVGRFKLNGRLVGYSPLSRLIELEGLRAGVEAKGAMWRTLRLIRDRVPGLEDASIDRLVERADEQSARLEEQRVAAAKRIVEA